MKIIGKLLTSFALLLAVVGFLTYLAGWQDSVIAAFVLGLIVAVVLIFAGSGISLVQANIASQREQENFNANAKENLAIMLSMQKVQNAQNSQLWRQAQNSARLLTVAQNGNTTPAFDFDEGIFDELEN